jgi:hypothetical protein
MHPVVLTLIIGIITTEAVASEQRASGFHLGLCADAGVVRSIGGDDYSRIASHGELEIGFQAENGFLVNGMFHGGYWGERYRSDGGQAQTWDTSGGGAQIGWKLGRLRLLTGYQWATVERLYSGEDNYSFVNDGYYYGPNAGISLVLIDRPGINLDVGARASFLRWDERADLAADQDLVMTTTGIHLHLYPSQWESRRSRLNGHFWFNFPVDAARVLLEFGPRLTLEILRAAVSIR